MPNKTKKFFFFLIKLAIVVGAFYFIYDKTVHNPQLNFQKFINQLESSIAKSYKTIFILLGFTIFNWFFEILKWQKLAAIVKHITFYNSLQQSLGSLTASLFTPNRIGEYGAKAIYYKKGNRRKIMLLNLLGNMSQMSVTVLIGTIGLLYLFRNFNLEIDVYRFKNLGYLAVILVLILIGIGLKGFKKIRGFYIDKIILFVKKIPLNTHLTIVLISLLRYVIFSHQFYFLLMVFEVNLDYLTCMSLITAMYFLASVVPSLALFDWLVKGSVAIWIFSLGAVNELIIVTITLLMWILNFGIPAIIGSYFVLNFKLPITENK